MVAFILSLISIALLLFINGFASLIFAIIALIIGKHSLKNKEKYAKEATIISKIVIVISIIAIIISFVVTAVTVARARDASREAIDEINDYYDAIDEEIRDE